MRQLAWLNTTPVPANPKVSDQKDKRTRKQRMDDSGQQYGLPEVSCEFLLAYLLEVGPVVSGAMGTAPIGWTDLKDWQHCLGIELPPWQCRVLIDLSREYLSFSKEAESEDCPCPFTEEEVIEDRREAVARELRVGFRALMMAGRTK